jgi:hypothetical protein
MSPDPCTSEASKLVGQARAPDNRQGIRRAHSLYHLVRHGCLTCAFKFERQIDERGVPMTHNVLGNIEQSEGSTDGIARVRYDQREIEVQMFPDGHDFETAVRLAAEVVQRLPALDKRGKQIAVAELRETYNNTWNEYDEQQDDGSWKTISNPQLSEAEFEAKLSLTAISITGDRKVEFFYDDEGLFWGHCVVVNSRDGVKFSETDAYLFG